MIVAVYPGTFDPITRGHEDLVRRASGIFDTLVVGVADSRNKKPFFLLHERLEIAQEVLGHHTNVKVISFSGLLKDFVHTNNARVIVRGLRAVSDFEYEFQMAGMNRYLLPDVEMMFMTPSDQYQFISGTIVREIAQLGGDVSKFVFPSVEKWLKKKFSQTSHTEVSSPKPRLLTHATAMQIIEVAEYIISSSESRQMNISALHRSNIHTLLSQEINLKKS
ncbi:Phosphopantetheine adenylyltransferase [Candidatus Vallotia lariciata]|nr:Phosphopantetheine adenylyltransferase [Candidatus Vallotia lariciata]